MSRCFPYTPLRREEPLIESIKLQKEKEKAKKKDKKERRKDRKENKEDINNDPENAQHKHRHKKRKHKEISLLQHKDDCSTKAVNDAIHLERSGLTEEHGMPIQNPESSEGSHDSNKRRKLVTNTANHSTNGTVLRIKLPTLRQVNQDLILQQLNQDLPPLPRVEPEQKAEPSVRVFKHEEQERCTTTDQACFSGRRNEAATPEKEKHKSRRHSKSERKKCSPELKQFNELIMNWAVPKLQLYSTDPHEEDWLFGARKQPSKPCPSEHIRVDDDSTHLSINAGSSYAPGACYVPELDIYQLPYVVPF